jgi:hypothetical protein
VPENSNYGKAVEAVEAVVRAVKFWKSLYVKQEKS